MSQSDGSRPTGVASDVGKEPAVQKHNANTNIIIVENENVKELLVDGILNLTVVNNLPRMSLYAERTTYGKDEVRRVIVCRLAMTPETVATLHENLGLVLKKLIEQNILRTQISDES